MKVKLASIVLFLFCQQSFAQLVQENYERAYDKINCMLDQTCELSFKKAVFTVENAYLNNSLDIKNFNIRIKMLSELVIRFISSSQLIYDLEDKEQVEKCAALFTIMTDTIPIQADSNQIFLHVPFSYDFDDIWGSKNWSKMFVSKLLETKTGNCHSLPFLYKILADEIGVKSHIAVAPNHFYIKNQSKANGWYNTELTSAIFPLDAWLMASGYIHINAIVNKLYMEALNDKQSVALCMIDLAKGYERKMGLLADYGFILKCCDAALRQYPHYINGIMLKAETKKKQFDALMEKYYAEYPADIFYVPEAKQLFTELNTLYTQIHELGFRKMPEDMYLDWLVSLKEQRSIYENKNILKFINSK